MMEVEMRVARREEQAAALELVFGHYPPAEGRRRAAAALELLRQGRLAADDVLILSRAGRVEAAMAAPLAPGAAASVWPPGARPGLTAEADQEALARFASEYLRQRGVKVAQTLLPTDQVDRAQPLLRAGFRHITAIWYLRHDHELPARLLTGPSRLTFTTCSETGTAALGNTLQATYEGTLDCPELTGARTVEETLAGHRGTGFDPELWWLACLNGQPAGVLLLTPLGAATMELSYMGLVPGLRRLGLGRELLLQALLEARARDRADVILTVDSRNQPAWNLYRRFGFVPYDRREVFLAIWPGRPG
jgi:ribosomal protein S18 acetylase RimI-like enzyme